MQTARSCLYQALVGAELAANLLYCVYKPHILEQAATVSSDGPQSLSYFILQTAYSTAVLTGEKTYPFCFEHVITVFSVSFAFTAVLVPAKGNRSACHLLLWQYKSSAAQHLRGRHHRG